MTDVASTVTLARTALYAGLLAGALDITAAIVTNLQVPARVVLQSVASGWMGRAAYQGGWPTAGLGLASHFAIMLVIAAIFVAAAAAIPALRRFWIPVGMVFGVAVWLAMTFLVVPMSASPLTPPADLMTALKPVAVHILAVGLPIAWVARRMLGAG
ncbi:hypothetical protein [Brevundimonas sp.]|uniref:hypothetical protein n=1 Tax=Brevundimonas sp. TaxID=1871086 RepID=UPI00121F6BFD|nr:hypothetical protein [Brevundimonas sp.]TAJ64468.1 MAG: hypothetical protein EPO49_05095 [Brevundimonas sp.]